MSLKGGITDASGVGFVQVNKKNNKEGFMSSNWKRYTIGALLACLPLSIAGCGGDGNGGSADYAQAVKGPVAQATVSYSDGTTTTTNANGYFLYKTGLSVKTTGGTYNDVDGKSRQAPDMATPAGKKNITPLTTLYVNADAATKVKLDALISGSSIDTIVSGALSGATNILITKLNETIGELLTQAKTFNTAPNLSGIATAVANLTAATISGTGGSAALATAAVTASGLTAAQATTVIAAATAIADKVKEGAIIVPVTSSPTTTPTTTADTTAPTAPTALTASSANDTTVILTWTASTDAVGVTGYTIFRDGTEIGKSTSATYTDEKAPLAVATSYTVKATDAAGNVSAASVALSVTTKDTIAPTAPTEVASTESNSLGVIFTTLTWKASTDAKAVTAYQIFRDDLKLVKLGESTTTTYEDKTVSFSKTYSYTVKALDAAGNVSEASTALSVTTGPNLYVSLSGSIK
jgi:chitodextrinase